VSRPSYGDAQAELRALTEDAAVVHGGHDLAWVEGVDAVSFLQGILSQDVAGMEPGEVRRSLLLAPQGKLRATLWLLRGTERVGIVSDAGWGDRVLEDLAHYRIRVKAELRRDGRPIWALWGPRAPEVAAVGERWEDRHGTTLAPLPLATVPRVLVAGEFDVGSLPVAGEIATTAARVLELEPVFGRDVDEGTIPQESGLAPAAVSFDKGCYLGQELVARIDSRGHVNRSLRSVAVTRNLIPPEGAEVWAGGRLVGSLTSVSESSTSPIGLGLLRREVGPGDEVEIRWEGGSVPGLVRA
jgi:folate-binding protein YgfZ